MVLESTYKAISAFGLTLLVVVSLLMPYETLLDFQLRREYIAQNLCENLDKGITSCRGSCYLEKKIQDDQKKSDATTRYTRQITRFSSLYLKSHFLEWEQVKEELQKEEPFYTNHYYFRFISKVFHPPKMEYDCDHTIA
jgi:hypothetical protein